MTALLSDVFSADGPLAAVFPVIACAQQLELAERIAAAMADNRVLVAEAGTGTGKTYAYLVPALLSGGKVIVSTGTRNLQDQLFTRDIPTIRKALKSPVKVALLKGRANYLCHYHLARSLADGRFLSRDDAAMRSGSPVLPARPAAVTRPSVPMSRRTRRCGRWSPRRATTALARTVRTTRSASSWPRAARRWRPIWWWSTITSFFADVMLRDEGTAELLPACNTVIFDEAHQLPEVASLFFGDSVSTAQLLELGRDAQLEGLASARDCLDLPKVVSRARKGRSRPAPDACRSIRPATRCSSSKRARLCDALAARDRALEALASLLETQAQRAEGLENCWRRASDLLRAPAVLAERGNADFVRWGETYTHSLQLNATPLAIAEIMQKQMSGHPRAWIFTSATLAVQDDFGHYCGEMGLVDDACSARWESPFDYPRQALLYAPRNLPDPNSPAMPRRSSRPHCRCSRRAAGGPFSCAPRCARCAERTSCSASGCPRRTRAAAAVAGGDAARTSCSNVFAAWATPS
jgi:ATP-dependent DNA helicase DinG